MVERINGIEGLCFAYDGCHKIYICEDEEDKKDAKDAGYDLLSMDKLLYNFVNSCSLRFINNWKCTKNYISQFEFEGEEE